MIGYLKGNILKAEDDGIILLAGDVGYNVLLPNIVNEKIKQVPAGEQVFFYIYFHQTERQPKPVLIGFNTEAEKAFFQLFISVDAIGPLKAVKAMEKSVVDIAMAIENKDVAFLSTLKGIGKRTAQKIIAALHGKTGGFFHTNEDNFAAESSKSNDSSTFFFDQVVAVLVGQLGHTPGDAREMVTKALKRNGSISSAEELFDEVLHETPSNIL